MSFEDLGRAAFEEAQRQRNGHGANDAWPEPDLSILSPHREPAPELPLECFGQFWADWLAAAGESKGAPVDFVAAPLLTSAGAMLANVRRASPWPGWTEAAIINTACVGLPSSGKSPARDAIMEIVRAIEAGDNADWAERTRRYETQAEEAKQRRALWEGSVKEAIKRGYAPPERPDNAAEPDAPTLRRLAIVDITTEKAGRLSAENRRGLVLARDELAGWLGALDKYGGASDRPFWLETYNGGWFAIDRVKDGKKPIQVPNLSIGLTGGVQPDRLASTMLAGDDDGLSARFIYSWPERVPPQRPTRAANHEAAVAALDRLRRLPFAFGLDHEEVAAVVPFAEPAAELTQQWREAAAAMENEASGLLLSWLGKLPGMAARLALVLEYLRWCGDRQSEAEPETVSGEAMAAALDFLESYALPMARRCFGDAALPQAERDAVALAKWIRRNRPGAVNARELRHAGAIPTREAERYDAALAELEAAGWVRPAPASAGPGRRRKDWSVNPAVRALQ